jgi:ATP-dependent RNA helicase DeaD
MPVNIQRLAQQFLRNPEHVSVIPKQMSAPLIEQSYIELQERQKFDALCRLIDMESPELAIIFGRTKRRVDELAEGLQKRGYTAEGLHGDLSQNQRDNVMRKFRDGSIDVLVATDVAARGLDVSGVTHVINFDLPQDPESYVHRIGRTGRAGKEGAAYTFVTPREIDHLNFIEKLTRHKITKKPIPSLAEAIEGKQKVTAERILALLDKDDHNEYKGLAIQLLEQHDSVHLLASALKLLTGDKKEVAIELTPEEPLRAKKRRHDVRSSGRKPSGAYGTAAGARRNDKPYDRSGSGSRPPRRDGGGSREYGSRDSRGSGRSEGSRDYGRDRGFNRSTSSSRSNEELVKN